MKRCGSNAWWVFTRSAPSRPTSDRSAVVARRMRISFGMNPVGGEYSNIKPPSQCSGERPSAETLAGAERTIIRWPRGFAGISNHRYDSRKVDAHPLDDSQSHHRARDRDPGWNTRTGPDVRHLGHLVRPRSTGVEARLHCPRGLRCVSPRATHVRARSEAGNGTAHPRAAEH